MKLGHWPNTIPLPELDLPLLDLREAQGIPYLVQRPSTKSRRVRYSGETYLQLANLDRDNPRAILRFTDKYGPLHTPLDGVRPFSNDVPYKPLDALRSARDEINTFTISDGVSLPFGPAVEPLPSFLYGAAIIADMTTAWRIYSGHLDIDEADWALSPGADPITDAATAAAFLEQTTKYGLATFSPRLRLIDRKKPKVTETELDTEPEWVDITVRVGAFAICCAELFNHIVEDATYRTCENPTCGRFFVRQQGRSKHGQHRMRGEVKYCSRSCATTVSKREYRKNQRKAALEGRKQ